MTTLRVLLHRLAGLFTKRRGETGLNEEIDTHLDLLVSEHLQNGATPTEARAAARRAFGGSALVRDAYRDQWALPSVDALLSDARRAISSLRRWPTSTAIVIATLAIGIGATTAIFTIVDGVLLRRTGIDGFDRLVMVWETDRKSGTTREPASLPDFVDFRNDNRVVQPLAGIMGAEVSLARRGADPVRLAAIRLSPSGPEMLGVKPMIGRRFDETDDRLDSPGVAIISESLWSRAFGRAADVIGMAVQLDDQPHTVVGVVRDGADLGMMQILAAGAYARGFVDRGDVTHVDVWLPLRGNPQELPRSTHPLFMVGRLSPGTQVADAQSALSSMAASLERAYPENSERGVYVERLEDVVFGPVRPALLVLLGAVVLVLLVACANVANLLLARAIVHAREVAVQTALGASLGRIARQFVIEGLLLTVAGAAFGVAFAIGAVRLLLSVAPAGVPRLASVGVDMRVLLVTIAICGTAGVLFGMVPTLQARATDLQGALKNSGGRWGSAGRGASQLRAALVIGEVALSVVLVTGAGLLIRSFWLLQQVDPGFRADRVLKAEFQLPASRYPISFKAYPNLKETHAFTTTLLERISALPGVEASAVAGNHPLDPGFTNSFVIVGREAESRNFAEISVRRVTSGYLATVGQPLVRGRGIEPADTTSSQPVIVINQAAERAFFEGREAIGAMVRFWGLSRRVVGVVGDERIKGQASAAPPAAYAPIVQAPSTNGAYVLMVRTSGDVEAMMGSVRGVVRGLDESVAVYGVEALERTVGRSLAERRFALMILGLFAGVALLLAALGIHGVFSYHVEQRSQEMGVRMALGAQPYQGLLLLLRQGAGLTLAGVGIGVAGAYALTRLMTSLLFSVTPTDPVTFGGAIAVMIAIAIAATLISSRRIMAVDPVVALRVE